MDRELDDSGDESLSPRGRKFVTVDDRSQTASALGHRRQTLTLGNDLVVQPSIEPADLCQLDQRIDRPGPLSVD